jgi:rhodanese-related sulfurtransferase
VSEWAAREVAGRLARGEIELIDVREPHERDAGYIAGSRHIELGQLASLAPSIPRDKPVFFQCRVGGRSELATRAFREAGWDAHNLEGGILAWVAAGLPLAPESGFVADH